MSRTFTKLDRRNISVFVFDLPKLSKAKCLDAIKIKLKNVFPYDLNEYSIRIRSNNNKKNSWICIVISKKLDDLFVFSDTLAIVYEYSKFTGDLYYNNGSYIEKIELCNGALVKSAIYTPKAEELSSLHFVDTKYSRKATNKGILKPLSKKYLIKFAIRTVLCVIPFLLICILCLSRYFNHLNRQTELINQQNLIAEENIKREKKLQLQLSQLINKYESIYPDDNMYKCLNIIFDCLGNGTKVENLSITKNSFELTVHASNSLAVLQRFESNLWIKEIKLSRSAKEQNSEYVNYSGVIAKKIIYADDSLSLPDKIKFYQDYIAFVDADTKKKEQLTVSVYAGELRKLFYKTNCTEQYMLLKNNDSKINMEICLHANGSHIFDLVKLISESSISSDLYSIQIHNVASNGIIAAILKVNTGIKAESVDKSAYTDNFEVKNISAQTMSNAFYSSPVKTNVTVKNKQPALQISNERKIIKNQLIYVGSATDKHNTVIVFFKDTKTDLLYKVPLKDDVTGDHCNEKSPGLYEVFIKNEIHEVRK